MPFMVIKGYKQGFCCILREMVIIVAISYYLYFSSNHRSQPGLSLYCVWECTNVILRSVSL